MVEATSVISAMVALGALALLFRALLQQTALKPYTADAAYLASIATATCPAAGLGGATRYVVPTAVALASAFLAPAFKGKSVTTSKFVVVQTPQPSNHTAPFFAFSASGYRPAWAYLVGFADDAATACGATVVTTPYDAAAYLAAAGAVVCGAGATASFVLQTAKALADPHWAAPAQATYGEYVRLAVGVAQPPSASLAMRFDAESNALPNYAWLLGSSPSPDCPPAAVVAPPLATFGMRTLSQTAATTTFANQVVSYVDGARTTKTLIPNLGEAGVVSVPTGVVQGIQSGTRLGTILPFPSNPPTNDLGCVMGIQGGAKPSCDSAVAFAPPGTDLSKCDGTTCLPCDKDHVPMVTGVGYVEFPAGSGNIQEWPAYICRQPYPGGDDCSGHGATTIDATTGKPACTCAAGYVGAGCEQTTYGSCYAHNSACQDPRGYVTTQCTVGGKDSANAAAMCHYNGTLGPYADSCSCQGADGSFGCGTMKGAVCVGDLDSPDGKCSVADPNSCKNKCSTNGKAGQTTGGGHHVERSGVCTSVDGGPYGYCLCPADAQAYYSSIKAGVSGAPPELGDDGQETELAAGGGSKATKGYIVAGVVAVAFIGFTVLGDAWAKKRSPSAAAS